MEYEDVTTALLITVPEFVPFYVELSRSYGGEHGFGTHVVVGGLFTLLKEQLRTSTAVEPLRRKVLAFIEELASSPDAEVQNLVVISFLENMRQLSEDEQSAVMRGLGPASAYFLRLHNLP